MRFLKGIALTLLAMAPLSAQAPATEVRALWVQRATIVSPEAIRTLVRTARAAGFNTLVVQVRGRGDAYYISGLEPRAVALSGQPLSFDPLEQVLTSAHDAGLRVHAWMNVNLVADVDPPVSPAHLVHLHPEWLMVPREVAADTWEMDRRSPEYLMRLSAYARAHRDRIEGLYLSPLQPDAADHTVSVIADVARRYSVDGIHLDYVRFPNAEFDYGPAALAQFRGYLQRWLSPAERRRYDARARREPLFYTRMFPQRWSGFRQERLTSLVTRLRASVKSVRPGAVFSAAVLPDAADAATHRFQTWDRWLASGLLDAVCPMAYTTDAAVFRAQIAGVKRLAGSHSVWAGIGAFQLPVVDTVARIREARGLGADGVILFSYDNLAGPSSKDLDYLSRVGREAFEPFEY